MSTAFPKAGRDAGPFEGGHYWTSDAASYESRVSPVTRQAIEPLLAAIGELPGCRLLDVACGPGNLLAVANARGARCTGIDLSPAMLVLAAERSEGLRLIVHDAADLPFEDEAFDAVVCAFGIEQLASPVDTLSKIERVLRPGGALALTVWMGGPDGHDLMRIAARSFWTYGTGLFGQTHMPIASPLAEATVLRSLLRATGFARVRIERHVAVSRHSDTQDALRVFDRAMSTASRAIEEQPLPARELIRQGMEASIEALRQNGEIRLQWPFEIVSARKP